MDGERQGSRKRNYNPGEEDEESLDLSLTLSQASSLFTAILAGEIAIKNNIFKFPPDLKDDIKKVILSDCEDFKQELKEIIMELDIPTPRNKIITNLKDGPLNWKNKNNS